MFANPRYTLKNAPVFIDAAKWDTEAIYHSVLRPCIMNDSEPKALIELDLFLVPACDIEEGNSWKKLPYDLEASICITPEDTIALIKHLSKLLGELFNDHNYLSDVVKYRSVEKIEKGNRQILPKSKSRKKKKS